MLKVLKKTNPLGDIARQGSHAGNKHSPCELNLLSRDGSIKKGNFIHKKEIRGGGPHLDKKMVNNINIIFFFY